MCDLEGMSEHDVVFFKPVMLVNITSHSLYMQVTCTYIVVTFESFKQG
jgi:hypothetical protein